jgi:transketolase
MGFQLGPRRGVYIDISREKIEPQASVEELKLFKQFDLMYRALCAMLYNYVPTSGHPGGSISSGRFAAGIVFNCLDYDVADPDRVDADIMSYAAGHKTLGLYALWALRNEVIRISCPDLLPQDEKHQLRLEDLLGFRRNPVTKTPLFLKYRVKPLDGHPTPATPFLRLSTGASGVGVATSLGLALGAMDYYGSGAPYVHIVEGEGGMTPGRVGEAMATAGTACLKNVILHVDWNQASIDSNFVCRDGDTPGEYVQWNPIEFALLHDWNAILVPDGMDFEQIFAAQRRAREMQNDQPTAIVYRTRKGWQYGIEGRASHGAGHGLCADGFFQAVKPFIEQTQARLPRCESANQRCQAGREPDILEKCFWEALTVIRAALGKNRPMVAALGQKLREARSRLDSRARKPRPQAPAIQAVFELAAETAGRIPAELTLTPGRAATLRGELGRVLQYYNQASQGAVLTAAADLYGSTSVNTIGQGFPQGWYNAATNPGARLLVTGGICEDAMSGILAGLSSYGRHLGVGSSYGAFIAALGHVSARLHAIGNQARRSIAPEPYKPFILICAHAGVKTGEDGPTHADPQALQLLQGNFPFGTMITLTPWDPQEIWTLLSAALVKRPAVIAPFVTRPSEKVIDRKASGLSPATAAATGVYLLRRAEGKRDGTLVLQGSEVGYAFVEQALPLLIKKGIDLDVYYVASAELFDFLPAAQKERVYPEAAAQEALGITGFTLPTMERWVCSARGRMMTLHPFRKGHFLGSGQADKVLEEAGLDGESQFKAIRRYLEKTPRPARKKKPAAPRKVALKKKSIRKKQG